MCPDDNDNNDSSSCDTYPTVAVDIHSTNVIKYYLLSLGMSIITMIVLKLVWKCSKFVSINCIKTIDELNHEFVERICIKSESEPDPNSGVKVDAKFMSEGILYRNGSRLRRNTGSATSMKSISLTDEQLGTIIVAGSGNASRTDSEMSKTEKGYTLSPPKSPTTNTNIKKIHAFGFVFTFKKE